MTMNPLPPQAYTKDTLLKAYHWLQAQSPSIKEMALTPDILVSLYLKSTRDGDHSLERPSVQNFKNELKNLAGMMGELDLPPAAPVTATAPQAVPTQAVSAPLPPMGASAQPFSAPTTAAPMTATAPAAASSGSGKLIPATAASSLDAASQEMLREIKEMLNLSSEAEALRAAIKLGHSKAQALLK